MVYQVQTLLLFCALWMLAGMVEARDTPLPKEQKTGANSFSYESPTWDPSNPTYTVQSGYEGFLVPAESLSIKEIVKREGIFGAVPILGKYAGRLALKVGVAVAALSAVVILGMIMASTVCKYTSWCQFTFNHGWDRSFSVSQDQVQSAAQLLAKAVEKFDQIEKTD